MNKTSNTSSINQIYFFMETAINTRISNRVSESLLAVCKQKIILLLDNIFATLSNSYLSKRTKLSHEMMIKFANQKVYKLNNIVQNSSQFVQKELAKPSGVVLQDEIVSADDSISSSQKDYYIPKTQGYHISFGKPEYYDEFKSNFEQSPIEGIEFDDITKTCFMKFSSVEILSLCKSNNWLAGFFGAGYRNAFTGYVTKAYGERINSKNEKEGVNGATKKLLEQAKLLKSDNENLNPKKMNLNNAHSNHQSFDSKTFIHSVLNERRFPGLIVGEVHADLNSKKFLIDNMNTFKEEGVKTIFLEHILYDTMQKDIDRYLQNPEAKMSLRLESYLNYLDEGFEISDKKWGYKSLVAAAKTAGIRIVAIDTEVSYRTGYDDMKGSNGPDRVLGMNFQAQQIILKEKGKGKFVALVGNGHVSKCDGISGLSEIINCPNLVIETGKSFNLKFDVLDFHKEKGFGGIVHALLELPPPVK